MADEKSACDQFYSYIPIEKPYFTIMRPGGQECEFCCVLF